MNPYGINNVRRRYDIEPACAGLWDLFDSPLIEDHKAIVNLCQACPMQTTCAEAFAASKEESYTGAGPSGTWAGVLYNRDSSPSKMARKRPSACRAGHVYTEETSYVDRRGYRICRTCPQEKRKAAGRAA